MNPNTNPNLNPSVNPNLNPNVNPNNMDQHVTTNAGATHYHPHTTTSTTDPTVNASSHAQDSQNVGQSLGHTLKDGFKVMHGAGEEIRGNINSALDGLGDSIAGRKTVPNTEGDRVAQRGAAEAEAGRLGLEGDTATRRV